MHLDLDLVTNFDGTLDGQLFSSEMGMSRETARDYRV